MIFEMERPVKVEDAVALTNRRANQYDRPPVPVPLVLHFVDRVATMRTGWIQQVGPTPERDPRETATAGDVRRRAGEMPNPLRALAAHLLEFADQCDAHGLTPLGVNVQTDYESTHAAYLRGSDTASNAAQVHVSARCVATEWITSGPE